MQLCKQWTLDHFCDDGVFCNHLSDGNAFCTAGGCFSNGRHAYHTGDRIRLRKNTLLGDVAAYVCGYVPGNVFCDVSRVCNAYGPTCDHAFLLCGALFHAFCDGDGPSHGRKIRRKSRIIERLS